MAVEFHDYTIKCQNAIGDNINGVLAECSGEVISQTQRNSRVDTSKTKNSFEYKVDEGSHTAYMGSNYENAIWEEFGTGEYAINGDGRKGGWRYKDAEGNWHYTTGKKPSRAFWKAYNSLKNVIIKHIQDSLKGL